MTANIRRLYHIPWKATVYPRAVFCCSAQGQILCWGALHVQIWLVTNGWNQNTACWLVCFLNSNQYVVTWHNIILKIFTFVILVEERRSRYSFCYTTCKLLSIKNRYLVFKQAFSLTGLAVHWRDMLKCVERNYSKVHYSRLLKSISVKLYPAFHALHF